MSDFQVILFYTTSAAMRAEKLLLYSDIKVDLIPAPREFSNDCAIAIRIPAKDLEKAKSIVEGAGIDTGGIVPAEE